MVALALCHSNFRLHRCYPVAFMLFMLLLCRYCHFAEACSIGRTSCMTWGRAERRLRQAGGGAWPAAVPGAGKQVCGGCGELTPTEVLGSRVFLAALDEPLHGLVYLFLGVLRLGEEVADLGIF